jgi:peptidoglycan hydrolase-like protein with peptidoglycan-binding domain
MTTNEPADDAAPYAARGRRAIVLGVVAAMVVVTLGLVLLGSRIQSPEQAAANASAPSAAPVTAALETRRLKDVLVTRGRVVPDHALPLVLRPAPDGGVVSGAVPRRGSTLREGDVALEINGRPVLVLQGRVPPYRDLSAGAEGSDVTRLQESLVRQGLLLAGEANGTLGPRTVAAVSRVYQRAGYRPPAGAVLPQREVVYVPRLPQLVLSGVPALGSEARNPLVIVGSGGTHVELLLGEDKRELLHRGQNVVVTTDAGQEQARVTGVGPAPAAVGGEPVAEDPQILVSATFTGPGGRRLPAGDYRVEVELVATKGPVLAAPLAAVHAAGDGADVVTVVRDGTSTERRVNLGTSAGGWIELVDPAGLAAGDLVVVAP